MAVNQDMFQKVADFLTAHPTRHSQLLYQDVRPNEDGEYRRCVAGTAVALGLNALDRDLYDEVPRGYSIGEYARQLLGLEEDQAAALFYEFNNAAALGMVQEFAKTGTSDAVLAKIERDKLTASDWGV